MAAQTGLSKKIKLGVVFLCWQFHGISADGESLTAKQKPWWCRCAGVIFLGMDDLFLNTIYTLGGILQM